MQKIICFHNPKEINGFLSNWYPSRFKDENGIWQIPKSAKNPFSNYEFSKSEKKQENIIINMVYIIILMRVFVVGMISHV